MEKRKNDPAARLRAYLAPPRVSMIITWSLTGLTAVCLLALPFAKDGEVSGFFELIGIFAFLFAGTFWMCVAGALRQTKKTLRDLTEKGRLERAVTEFSGAVPGKDHTLTRGFLLTARRGYAVAWPEVEYCDIWDRVATLRTKQGLTLVVPGISREEKQEMMARLPSSCTLSYRTVYGAAPRC